MANRVEIIFISKKHNILKNLKLPVFAIYIIVGTLIAATVSTLLLFVNGTHPTFIKMHLSKVQRENLDLTVRLESLNSTLKRAQNLFDHHVAQDNRERTYWQMAHIHPDIWSMGIGGKQVERSPDIINKNTERIINEIYESIDVLRGKLYLRRTSLDDIDKKIQRSRNLWAHIPSIHPVPGKALGSGYGYRVDPIDRKTVKMHWGLDIGAPRGTNIIATADGVVSEIGWHSGYGLTVVIDHGFGFETRYGHCQRIRVKEGDAVKRGDVVATVGNTGRSIAPHLHYEVQVSGMRVNPKPYIDLSDVVVD